MTSDLEQNLNKIARKASRYYNKMKDGYVIVTLNKKDKTFHVYRLYDPEWAIYWEPDSPDETLVFNYARFPDLSFTAGTIKKAILQKLRERKQEQEDQIYFKMRAEEDRKRFGNKFWDPYPKL